MRKTFFLLLGVFALFPVSPGSPAQVVDRIVALVNDDVITLSEVEEMAKPFYEQVIQSTPPAERAEQLRRTREQVLEQLIENKILEQEIRIRKIEIADRDVDAEIQAIMDANKLTENELKAALAKEGMTYSAYRQKMRIELGKMRLVNREIKSKIVIQEEDLRTYYQNHLPQYTDPLEIKVQQIFFAIPRPADPERIEATRKKASMILERARNGEDFAALARKYSEGPEASEGGLLGYFKRREMLPELDEAAFALQPGQVSDLILTDSGFHILRVQEHKGGVPKPFREVQEKIRMQMIQTQAEKKFADWMKALKSKSYVEKRL